MVYAPNKIRSVRCFEIIRVALATSRDRASIERVERTEREGESSVRTPYTYRDRLHLTV